MLLPTRPHTQKRPYPCTFPGCAKILTCRSNLKEHQRIHTRERPYPCTWPRCAKIFARKQGLKEHQKIHTKERPYPCTWPGCAKTFTRKHSLKEYQKIHTKKGLYPCTWPHCAKTFARLYDLQRHQRIHTGERPYLCTFLGCTAKPFTQKSTLKTHQKIHTGERHYPCTWPGCAKTFARKDYLKKHQKVHPCTWLEHHQNPGTTASDKTQQSLELNPPSETSDPSQGPYGSEFCDSGIIGHENEQSEVPEHIIVDYPELEAPLVEVSQATNQQDHAVSDSPQGKEVSVITTTSYTTRASLGLGQHVSSASPSGVQHSALPGSWQASSQSSTLHRDDQQTDTGEGHHEMFLGVPITSTTHDAGTPIPWDGRAQADSINPVEAVPSTTHWYGSHRLLPGDVPYVDHPFDPADTQTIDCSRQGRDEELISNELIAEPLQECRIENKLVQADDITVSDVPCPSDPDYEIADIAGLTMVPDRVLGAGQDMVDGVTPSVMGLGDEVEPDIEFSQGDVLPASEACLCVQLNLPSKTLFQGGYGPKSCHRAIIGYDEEVPEHIVVDDPELEVLSDHEGYAVLDLLLGPSLAVELVPRNEVIVTTTTSHAAYAPLRLAPLATENTVKTVAVSLASPIIGLHPNICDGHHETFLGASVALITHAAGTSPPIPWHSNGIAQEAESIDSARHQIPTSLSSEDYECSSLWNRRDPPPPHQVMQSETGNPSRPSLWCHSCDRMVNTRSELKKHKERHEKPFLCGVFGCKRKEGFGSKNDLDRHIASCHSTERNSGHRYNCNIGQCATINKLWPRWDNFKQHLKRFHQTEVSNNQREQYQFKGLQCNSNNDLLHLDTSQVVERACMPSNIHVYDSHELLPSHVNPADTQTSDYSRQDCDKELISNGPITKPLQVGGVENEADDITVSDVLCLSSPDYEVANIVGLNQEACFSPGCKTGATTTKHGSRKRPRSDQASRRPAKRPRSGGQTPCFSDMLHWLDYGPQIWNRGIRPWATEYNTQITDSLLSADDYDSACDNRGDKDYRNDGSKIIARTTAIRYSLRGRSVKKVYRDICKCTDDCGDGCKNRSAGYECDDGNCDRDDCTNRTIQRLVPQVQKFQTKNKGFGLLTTQDLKARQAVIEYEGEYLSKAESENSKSVYRLRVRDEDRDVIIDGARGGLAKFINHSCDPNCDVSVKRVQGITRVLIVAIRDIAAWEELTFDYKVQPNLSEEMENGSETTDSATQICLCGSTNCKWKHGQQNALDEMLAV